MKIFRLLPIMLATALLTTATACSDDDDAPVVQEADVAAVHLAEATYCSLSFAWQPVAGVNQYGYILTDAKGATVTEGVTDQCAVTFGDLATDAPYSFELRVYGAVGTPSYHHTIQTRTLPIRQLDTPAPTAEQVGNKVRLTWEPVEGAAAYLCTYIIGDAQLKAYTMVTTIDIAGLAPGTHTLALQAVSAYGGYTDSAIAEVTAQRSRTEIGSVSGTYTSGLISRKNSWPATMRIFDDGSYIIEAFYNYEGYDLDFYVDTDVATGTSHIGVYNFTAYPDAQYFVMETGRPTMAQIDLLPGFDGDQYGSTFTGDATSGSLSISTHYVNKDATDTFTW